MLLLLLLLLMAMHERVQTAYVMQPSATVWTIQVHVHRGHAGRGEAGRRELLPRPTRGLLLCLRLLPLSLTEHAAEHVGRVAFAAHLREQQVEVQQHVVR